MLNKEDHDLLLEIRTALLGADGQGGLIRDFQSTKKDYFDFKRKVLAIFYFVLGTGILGTVIYKVAELVH